MEGLLILLALGVLIVPLVALILTIVNTSRIGALTRRVDALQQEVSAQLHSLRRAQAAPAPAASAPPPAAVTPPPPPPAPRAPTPSEPFVAPTPAAPARSGSDFERQIGTRVTAWLGAIAFALAGAFLVKYSFDAGWLGPTARVTGGLLFGVVLLAVGEWLRVRLANIAQALSAAGIAVLFAALLAATSLYHLIPIAAGFVLMALVTATAVALSLRQGPFVALLGLVGGFATPLAIGGEESNPWLLFAYLVLLQAGLVTVSRKRQWWAIAALTAVGGMGWALLALNDIVRFGGTLPVGLFLLASVAVAQVMGAREHDWDDTRVPIGVTWSVASAGLLLLAALAKVGQQSPIEWAFLGLLGAACLVLARRQTLYEGLPWVAALVTWGALFIWAGELLPESYAKYWWTVTALGALYVGGAFTALWGAVRPDRFAVLSAASGVAYLLMAYLGLHRAPWPLPFGVQALALAAVFVLMAHAVARVRATLAQGAEALAAFAVAVTACVSLAVPMELERSWISVAWALELPAVAWIASRLRVPWLDRVLWVLGGAVVVRLLLNPAVLDYPTGTGIVWNWLLYGYGIPLAAFIATALLLHRLDKAQLACALEIAAVALGLALLTLQVRQYFHPGQLGASGVGLVEWGALSVIWMLYALGLRLLHERLDYRWATDYGGIVIALLATVQALLTQGLLDNPIWSPHAVGTTPVFNRLLFVYGLPALLAAILAHRFRPREPRSLSLVLGGGALGLLFLTVTLMVRQGFRGDILSHGTAAPAEMYSYSLAWVLLATALLVAAIVTRGAVVRYGSALVMLVAVGKVFLIDTANLRDLYRVLSLFGLGVSLMLLAFLYQRFVFADRRS